MMPKNGSAAATILPSNAVDWSIADYKSNYADYLEVCRVYAMLLHV